MSKEFIYFIGTSAELIKLLPVIKAFEEEGIKFSIYASGQTDLKENELSEVLQIKVKLNKVLRQNKSSMFNFGLWTLRSLFKTIVEFWKLKKISKDKIYVIVHGDTASSLIGALASKLVGLKVLHIESGLRSRNFMEPFPEEICRYITSWLADIHFCPNSWAVSNLKYNFGKKVNTLNNTSLEMITQGLKLNLQNATISKLKSKYFLLILHRQENVLFKRNISSEIVRTAVNFATKDLKCVFVMHKLTENFLKEIGIYDEIAHNPNIVLIPRTPYLEFINVIRGSEFLLTDGGSNQEETYYLGKPTLILRNVTERVEGLNENSLLMKENINILNEFLHNYKKYERKEVKLSGIKPSEIIVKEIKKL
jgi:UDP-N-acetylglucosamine 2-epimerase (non-hydrolysing)